IDIRRALHQPNEESFAIEIRESLAHLCFRPLVPGFSVDGRKNAARDRQRVRHEDQFAGPIANASQFLLDLRNVLMREWLVRIERIRSLRMVRVRGSLRAGTGRSSFGVNNYAAGYKIARNQRSQGQ